MLYICADEYILHTLRKLDREAAERHHSEHKLYLALLDDVTGAVGEMNFRSVHKGIESQQREVAVELASSEHSRMNIKTKRGENFTRFSIKALLTNSRYIGKWYRNKHNASKRQNKLMPYERFTEVELGHGSVIDAGLWQLVQNKVKELDGSRTQASIHCYPLSGLLVFADGSSFTGSLAVRRGSFN